MRNLNFKMGVLGALLSAAVAFGNVTAEAQVLPGQITNTYPNLLDNGQFNVAQRGTTAVTTITTTAKYLWDRWAGFSGTSTNETLTNITSSLPSTAQAPVFTAGAQVQRASGQTGTANVCLVQEIPSVDIDDTAGQPVTFSFWAQAGSNFSASGNALVAKVTTGTGTDEGLATFITGFTGAATPLNGTATLTTSWQRFAFTANMSATSTEAAVTLCYTPTGTAGTNDYFQVTGVEFNVGTFPANFEIRPYGVELAKDQRYFFQENETVSGTTILGTVEATSATAGVGLIPLPVPLRTVPSTVTCTFGTMKVNIAGTATALTGCASSAGQSTPNSIAITTTVGSGQTAGQIELLQSGNSTGGGLISASADF